MRERDIDLNLLRVFVTVAEAGGVTAAASRLYLTQSAVSAALARLATAMGARVFARKGRGLVLTARGKRLLATAKPHLDALVRAAFEPGGFDPRTSERVVRLGLSDAYESVLLPKLVRALGEKAPRMKIVVVPVQFRNVATAIDDLDLAITVADELPAGIERRPLRRGQFVCLFDPRHGSLGRRPTLERYLAHEHVVVSYNGDLRGIVEDLLGYQRNVRVSISSFHGVGALVEGSALVATVPRLVAEDVRSVRRRLAIAPLPFAAHATAPELLWRAASADDEAVAFVRAEIDRLL